MRICLFSHYFTESYIPNYVLYYLEKLEEICDKVILLTNEREIKNIPNNIEYHLYKNEGYDFGMYYKYLINQHIECDQLFLVNDSMVLFNNLNEISDWIYSHKNGLIGLTDSIEIDYHLQSYFLVLNKDVQIEFIQYLLKKGIINDFRKVIRIYEVGFSNYLKNKGKEIYSKFPYQKFTSKGKSNSVIYHPKKLIENGLPMVKRKVIFNKFSQEERNFLQTISYNFNEDHWGVINTKKEDSLNINYLKL
jgi:lipopolysaccharide biosynthesis protein